jgi:hypothetical protein
MAAYRGEVGGARFDLATLSCKINFTAEDSGLPEGDDPSAQDPQGGQGADPPAPPAPDTKPEGKTFTDEQLDRIIGKRAKEAEKNAKQATEAAIAEQLGVSIEEAKKIIDASREADEAKKSEIDKLKKQNESIKKASETKVSEVQRDHHIDRVKLQLIRAGVALPEDTAENPDSSNKALDRVVGLVSVPVGASVDEIKDNIAELKTEFASLFAQPEKKEEENKGNPGSHPSGAPRKPVLNNESFADLGARLAKENNSKRMPASAS